MNILYITADPLEYSSSANMRNKALIQGLIEQGNTITTLSQKLNKDSIYVDQSPLDLKIYKRYWLEDKPIMKINKEEKNNRKELKKKIKKFLYNIYTRFSIYDPKKRLVKCVDNLRFDQQFDVIISSSDPKSAHLLAEALINKTPNITKKWIQYWGDPFAYDINSKKWIPKYFVKKEEKRILSKADKIIYVSPFTLEKQKELYKTNANKMFFLPIPYKNEKIYKDTNNKKYSIGYFGDYNKNDRNIEPLYKAIGKEQDYSLLICGNSDLKLSTTKNITVNERQPVEKIEEYEGKIDLLVCICNRKGNQIPGKIYHYAATNRPILIIIDGEEKAKMRQYFDNFHRYYICENEEEDIINTIKNIRKERKTYSPLEEINASNIASKFIKIEG